MGEAMVIIGYLMVGYAVGKVLYRKLKTIKGGC